LTGPLVWDNGRRHALPQDFADMLGWENQVAAVASAYHQLSAAEKAKCVIFAANYGEAGAIDHFGNKYQLPGAINVNGSYYTWGPGELTGEILLTIGISRETLENWCTSVEHVTTITHPYACETNIPVYLSRTPRISLQALWPDLISYRF